MGIDLCNDALLSGYPVGWFSPSYKMLVDVWRDMRHQLKPYISRSNVQERRIELVTGGVLDMWSLDNQDAGRGRRYARVIVDEAAMVRDLAHIWQASIRPTLTDLQGDGWFMSTPKGMNGFWQLYQLGIDDNEQEWQSWQMPTLANPYIAPDEVKAAGRTLPERIFAQEYLAQFLDDAGGVFRGVMDCATAREAEPAGHECIIGVDWGKHNDFTVITVLSLDGVMLAMDRFNQIDYTLQVGRLRNLYDRYRPLSIIAERNSMGEPLIEQLQRDGLPVTAFQTTNASKAAAIEALALAFEREEIAILNEPILIGELQAYEMERLPSGMLRYNAPPGMHDDCVMSLALAWQGVRQDEPVLIMENPFYA